METSIIENIFFNNSIIKEKKVKAQIIKISKDYRDKNKICVTLKLLDGKHIGREVCDKVSTVRLHQLNWKYHVLRNSAGLYCPDGNESLEDISALLTNKIVTINLSEYKYTNFRGYPDSCQSINYVTKYKEGVYWGQGVNILD